MIVRRTAQRARRRQAAWRKASTCSGLGAGPEMIRGVTASSTSTESASSTIAQARPLCTSRSSGRAAARGDPGQQGRARPVQTAHLQPVPQEVGGDFLVRAVGDVGQIGLPAVLGLHALLDVRDLKPAEAIDPAHPLGVALGQVVVDRDDVAAPAPPAGDGRGHGGREGLALAGRHLDDGALGQRQAAGDLRRRRVFSPICRSATSRTRAKARSRSSGLSRWSRKTSRSRAASSWSLWSVISAKDFSRASTFCARRRTCLCRGTIRSSRPVPACQRASAPWGRGLSRTSSSSIRQVALETRAMLNVEPPLEELTGRLIPLDQQGLGRHARPSR